MAAPGRGCEGVAHFCPRSSDESDMQPRTVRVYVAAQTLAKAERNDEAKAMLQMGIQSAKRTGNQHALSEMSAMLEELS